MATEGRRLSYAEQPFDLRGMKVLRSGEAPWGAFVFDNKGICWPQPPSPAPPAMLLANNAPMALGLPTAEEVSGKRKTLWPMLDRELNRFFPQPRRKAEGTAVVVVVVVEGLGRCRDVG